MSTTLTLLNVRHFAVASHAKALYGDLPYEYHLVKCQDVVDELITAEMLDWAGVSMLDLRTAVWCHDLVEDTPVTVAQIQALYGESVASMVHAVTDVEGANRHERKFGTASNPGPMIKLLSSRGGLIVKLVDRIANVRAASSAVQKLPAHKQKKTMLPKYRDEHGHFTTLRASSPILAPLFHVLDELLA